ncbi:MAG: SMP-30/gluconolactonase/LRE family protein [Pseudomonadota bacterium]|nr:SMP-30/gluconolactonase/LRE family protein [Pseudomonadota bacterium]
MSAFHTLLSGYTFFEGPRWRDGRLWLSDFYTHQVITCDTQGRVEKVAEVPGQPSGLGWLPDGRLLIVSMRDRRVLRREADGRLVTHADLSHIATGHCNDMAVDAQGRAWVGNFGFDLMGGGAPRTARLARVDVDGQASVAADGLYFPNAILPTPDGRTLIVNETMGNRLSAFDIAPDGSLGPRRDWACFGPLVQGEQVDDFIAGAKVAPDGGALDAEGAVWVADAVGRRALRVAEGGRVLQEVSTGEQGCFACALGGPDGRTLFLCVAPDFLEHHRAAAREAQIWTTRVDVPGVAG